MHGESVDAEAFSYGVAHDLLTALRVTSEPVDNSVTLVRRCASGLVRRSRSDAGEPRAVSRVLPCMVRAGTDRPGGGTARAVAAGADHARRGSLSRGAAAGSTAEGLVEGASSAARRERRAAESVAQQRLPVRRAGPRARRPGCRPTAGASPDTAGHALDWGGAARLTGAGPSDRQEHSAAPSRVTASVAGPDDERHRRCDHSARLRRRRAPEAGSARRLCASGAPSGAGVPVLAAGRDDHSCRAAQLMPAQNCSAFMIAEATVGTTPSSRNAGMKQVISGSTLRTPTRRAAAST